MHQFTPSIGYDAYELLVIAMSLAFIFDARHFVRYFVGSRVVSVRVVWAIRLFFLLSLVGACITVVHIINTGPLRGSKLAIACLISLAVIVIVGGVDLLFRNWFRRR